MNTNKTRLLIIILLIILIILFLRLTLLNVRNCIKETFSQDIDNTLMHRLKNLEPLEPANIDDPPFYYRSTYVGPFPEVMPSKIYSIKEIFSSGSEIQKQFIYNDLEWKRPAYKEYWHSTVSGGRWSYVPEKIHFAMHRIFSTYPTASISYDFAHDLGIWDEYLSFDKYYSESPYEFIEVVVMQTDIQKIISYRNQVLIVGKPQLTGLQAVIIPTKDINGIDNDNNLLIQLVTPEGDIIDYTTINLVKSK